MQEDEEKDDEDGTFGTASSPLQLPLKCQEDTDDEYDDQGSSSAQQDFLFV